MLEQHSGRDSLWKQSPGGECAHLGHWNVICSHQISSTQSLHLKKASFLSENFMKNSDKLQNTEPT